MASRVGLKLVAGLEATKGAVVLAAGVGLFRLVHHDVQTAAEHFVRHMHLNPASHYPSVFIDAMTWLDDSRLRMLALGALCYATVRLAEAYGLWTDRPWAEWFGALSGGIYVPIEVYKLFEKLTWTRFGFLAFNAVIVGYLSWVLVRRREERRRVAEAAAGGPDPAAPPGPG